MDSINKLIELFRQFPGIGPRQAKRFVYFLLSQTNAYRDLLAENIKNLKDKIKSDKCVICRDPRRDDSCLLIVSRDVDYENVEKSHAYDGKYFVLGGNIPILEKDPLSKIRAKELFNLVGHRAKESGLKEIILALNLTVEGENTEDFLKKYLGEISAEYGIKISELGRGLSTGLELEYSDSETIKNALKNRG